MHAYQQTTTYDVISTLDTHLSFVRGCLMGSCGEDDHGFLCQGRSLEGTLLVCLASVQEFIKRPWTKEMINL